MKTAQYEADREFLCDRFPCFRRKGEPKLPLKVGISGDMERLGVLPHRRLRAFLGAYTRGQAYQEAITAGGPRYNLAGMPSGRVDEESRHKAFTALGAMRKRLEERDELAVLRKMRDGLRAWAVATSSGDDYLDGKRWDDLNALIYPEGARGESAPATVKESEGLSGSAEGVTPAEAGAAGGVTPAVVFTVTLERAARPISVTDNLSTTFVITPVYERIFTFTKWVHVQCSKDPECCHQDGHQGVCDDLPF